MLDRKYKRAGGNEAPVHPLTDQIEALDVVERQGTGHHFEFAGQEVDILDRAQAIFDPLIGGDRPRLREHFLR